MGYIKIETSAARHPKLMRAGAAAAWLWVCSIAHCQESLSDGFVSREVLLTFGLATPQRLARRLVATGLWHVSDSGWMIHDYHHYNKSAAERKALWHKRVQSGSIGGRSRKQSAKHDAEANDKHSGQSYSSSSSSSSTHTDRLLAQTAPALLPIDTLAQQLLNAYPKQGWCSLHAAAAALADVLHNQPPTAFAALLDRLDAHKRSAKWTEQAGRFIPRLDRYLRDGTHLQDMPSADAVAAASSPGARWRPDDDGDA